MTVKQLNIKSFTNTAVTFTGSFPFRKSGVGDFISLYFQFSFAQRKSK
jgi:hypothetical protein